MNLRTNQSVIGPLRATARSVVAVSVAGILCACSTAPFYNEARDKQAQDLAQSAAKIDLVALVDAVQARFVALSELDAQSRAAHAEMRRDLEVSVVAGSTKPLKDIYVSTLLERRMTQLTGHVLAPAVWRKRNDARVAAAVNADEANKALRRFAMRVDADVETCESLAAYGTDGVLKPEVKQVRGADAEELYKAAADRCRESAAPPNESADTDSHIGKLQQQFAQAKNTQASAAVALADFKNQLQLAQSEYDNELKALAPKPGDAGDRAALMAAAEKLDARLKQIESTAKNNRQLKEFLHASTLQSIQALQTITDVVASGQTDMSKLTADQARSVAIVRLLPTMADDADKLLKEAKRPRVAPLLLSLDQQRLALEGYEQEQKLQDAQVASYRQALDLAWQEYHSLGRARYLLDAGVPLDRSLSDVIVARDPKQLYALYSSFAEYFDQAQLLREQSEAAEVSARAYPVDREMLHSKYAALQWQKLLNDMSGVLADFHKAGVKPQDIAEFAKALGLLYIGAQTGN